MGSQNSFRHSHLEYSIRIKNTNRLELVSNFTIIKKHAIVHNVMLNVVKLLKSYCLSMMR